jgi:hypothetical protein
VKIYFQAKRSLFNLRITSLDAHYPDTRDFCQKSHFKQFTWGIDSSHFPPTTPPTFLNNNDVDIDEEFENQETLSLLRIKGLRF